MYFGHKDLKSGSNCSYELATFCKYHMPLINCHVYSSLRIDYLLEKDESSCVSLQPMVNSSGADVPQMLNHCTAFNDRYVLFFLDFNVKK